MFRLPGRSLSAGNGDERARLLRKVAEQDPGMTMPSAFT
jgi:hypothetical protein